MEIDNTSRLMLVRLAEVEEASASELRDALGMDQNQQVHYRTQKHEDLVEVTRLEEQPGSRRDAKIYALTPEGEEWVRDHRHEVTVASLDDAERLLERLSEQVHQLQESVERAEEQYQRETGHYNEIRSRVASIESELKKLRMDFGSHHHDDLDDRLSEVESAVESAAEEDDVKGALSGQRDNINDALGDFDQRISSHSDRLTELEERVEKQENRTLLDFLLGR